jgi:glycosyltransferase involved in cell wall biosynthesis
MRVSAKEILARGETAKGRKDAWRAFFVTWAKLRRADTLAELLGIPSHSVRRLWRGTPPLLTLWKYLLQGIHTLLLCLRHRPRVVFVTSPPIFAVLSVYVYALIFRARYVIDFHSGSFLQRHWRRWDPLQRFLARRAALNLAHNARNAEVLAGWGVKHAVLPSLPPRLAISPQPPPAAAQARGTGGRPLVVYITSFKDDEPVAELLDAARSLPEIDFRVSGRPPEGLRAGLPSNVVLTGFLGEEDYLALLARADLIVALTKQSDTLLYGAQEAIALHKPLVLSRTATLEEYFPEGTVFAENTAAGLRDGIREALRRRGELAAKMALFEARFRAEGEARLEAVRRELEEPQES